MTQRIRIGLAGAGCMWRIHAASLSARSPAAVTHTELSNNTGLFNNTDLFNNTEQESQ